MKHEKTVSKVIYATPPGVRRVILHFESYPKWNHFIPKAEPQEDGSIFVTDADGTAGLCKITRNDSSGFGIQFPGEEGDHWDYEFEEEGNRRCLLKLTIKSKVDWKQKAVTWVFGPVLTLGLKVHLEEVATRANGVRLLGVGDLYR